MKAMIVTIGDELLIGHITDTNATYISQKLNSVGIIVAERMTVSDDPQQIKYALLHGLANYELIITTGGLGPTSDDRTKDVLAHVFDSELVRDPEVERHVRDLLARRNIPFNSYNYTQVLVPKCSETLFNAHGTAPGLWTQEDESIVVNLPGVPFEMRWLMEEEVLPRLRKIPSRMDIVHRTLVTFGIAESLLAERIAGWEKALPSYLKLSYLPAPNMVRLRLSAYEVDGDMANADIEAQFRKLYDIIPDNIVGYDTDTLQSVVHRLLRDNSMSLAVAESCTGGRLASAFTAMPGASDYFLLGATTYSNASKIGVLGVNPETIEHFGAVSEQTAMEMAECVRRITGADFGVATTGIAGPTGGSDEKPVGTVWIAVATAHGCKAVMRNCGTHREQIMDRAVAYAIEMLRDAVLGRNM